MHLNGKGAVGRKITEQILQRHLEGRKSERLGRGQGEKGVAARVTFTIQAKGGVEGMARVFTHPCGCSFPQSIWGGTEQENIGAPPRSIINQ